jgi:hypothetical protein
VGKPDGGETIRQRLARPDPRLSTKLNISQLSGDGQLVVALGEWPGGVAANSRASVEPSRDDHVCRSRQVGELLKRFFNRLADERHSLGRTSSDSNAPLNLCPCISSCPPGTGFCAPETQASNHPPVTENTRFRDFSRTKSPANSAVIRVSSGTPCKGETAWWSWEDSNLRPEDYELVSDVLRKSRRG